MHCRCLSLRALPHQPPLLLDLLYDYDSVSRFYPRKANLESAIAAAKALDYPAARRSAVTSILRNQNKKFGSGDLTEANLARFEHGAVAVVTGQQVGLFSGPAYAIYKALAAVRTAKDLTAAGVAAVPVFWMATEDHDLDEVRHTTFFHEGALTRFELPALATTGTPVGKLELGRAVTDLVRAAALMLGGEEGGTTARILREAYQPGETYGSSFARLFAHLMGEFGLILLDPLDEELHRIAAPVYAQAAERRDELNRELLQRGKELEAAGYSAQVKVTDRSTLLFSLAGGIREPVTATEKGFKAGGTSWTHEELLTRVKQEPEKFSPNALLRPVVQDFLMPSAVYLGGPAEVSYCAQSEVLYRTILRRAPALLPRPDFTLVDPKAQRILEEYDLEPEDVWAGCQSFRRKLQVANIPKPLAKKLAKDSLQMETILEGWKKSLMKLDPTLERAVATAAKKIQYQASKLTQKAGKAVDRKSGVLQGHMDFLNNLLYPRKTLQSRELNFLPLLARWGAEGLRGLEEHAGVKHIGQHFVVPIP